MQETQSPIKQAIFDIDEQLWLQAKACAALQNILLKDFVARAIRNEIERSTNK